MNDDWPCISFNFFSFGSQQGGEMGFLYVALSACSVLFLSDSKGGLNMALSHYSWVIDDL